ncbi:MAG: chloramphenicol-sensitive protein RarD [Paracoccaceae bacterium]|jgi:chloramphenicol-sensitive protein RarD
MTDAYKGILAMIGCCTVWGLSPIFYKLLIDVPPLELLSHRLFWSVLVFAIVLAMQRRLREIPVALNSPRKVILVFGAAAMIAVNWTLFIFSVQVGRVVEAALGYYIFPLVAVCIGYVALGERLGWSQALAVVLATIAVTVLTLGLGAPPWISLALAVTFGIYGLLKRWVAAGPVVSVATEALVVSPLCILYLFLLGSEGIFGRDLGLSALLILSGPLTAVPLALFSYAAKRASMATIGLVQYVNPSLQFFCAVLLFGEPMTVWHAIAFPIIWIALALYSWAGFRGGAAPIRS